MILISLWFQMLFCCSIHPIDSPNALDTKNIEIWFYSISIQCQEHKSIPSTKPYSLSYCPQNVQKWLHPDSFSIFFCLHLHLHVLLIGFSLKEELTSSCNFQIWNWTSSSRSKGATNSRSCTSHSISGIHYVANPPQKMHLQCHDQLKRPHSHTVMCTRYMPCSNNCSSWINLVNLALRST